ncbi:MAG: hypothetical protein ACYCYM_10520 [Saccharofermentanales bacterium]
MDMVVVIFIICAFVGQLLAGIAIVYSYVSKSKKKIRAASFQPAIISGNDYFDGKKYFFENTIKKPPLYRFYGEISQFAVNIPSADALLCGADELAMLLDRMDPAESGFTIWITDDKTGKTVQFLCDVPDYIGVEITAMGLPSAYSGKLVFPADMKVILFDYFAGFEVIKGFALKPAKR